MHSIIRIVRRYKRTVVRRNRRIKNHSFAVTGTYSGAGVTVLAVNFAVYLAKFTEGKIAVIELNRSGDFLRMEKEMEDMQGFSRMDMGFCIENIFFFEHVPKERIPYIQARRFSFYIYDIGTDFLRNKEEFIRSEQKIVVGSHLEWRICQFKHFVNCVHQIVGYEKWEYVDTAGKKRGKVYFIDSGRIKLKHIPAIEDIFEVSDVAAGIYQSFL